MAAFPTTGRQVRERAGIEPEKSLRDMLGSMFGDADPDWVEELLHRCTEDKHMIELDLDDVPAANSGTMREERGSYNGQHPDGGRVPCVDFRRSELRVLGSIAKGNSLAQAADELFLTRETVKSHLSNAKERSGARSTTHMVAMAITRGYISLEEE